MSHWKTQLQQAFDIAERRKGQSKKKIIPSKVMNLRPGDTVYFVPKNASHVRYGQRAKVIRAARQDVKSPSIRIEFQDGIQQSVLAGLLRRTPAPAVEPPFLQEARRLPSWKRLVNDVRHPAATQRPNATPDQAAQHRARQMVGMLRASIPEDQRPNAAQVLLDAARIDAQTQETRQAQRGGRGPVRHETLPAPSNTIDPRNLDQEQRAMINLIAKSIHRRYFLSDKQIEQTLSEEEREQARIHGVLRQIISLGQREAGSTDATNKRGGKGNELQGLMHDNLTAAYQKALEVCQWLEAGQLEHARTLAAQVQQHRAVVTTVDAELDKHRVKHHTGRYFHGDILSVRVEHIEYDDDGNFQSYLGMTQYYARVVFIYDEDGHTLIVANAPELESLTGLQVGPQGWASLCRWVHDMSERAGGRKQGRRQDDDERLIYRENEGVLRLRAGLECYPGLILALDGIRRALMVGIQRSGILPSEVPEGHPKAGEHPPPSRLLEQGKR